VAIKISRVGQAKAGRVEKLAATGLIQGTVTKPVFSNFAVTAARNGEGNLHVAIWHVAKDDIPTLTSERIEGAISEVAVTSNVNRVVAAMRDGAGKLRLIAYKVSNDGAKLTRLGTATGGKIESVQVSLSDTSGRAQFVTASRLPSGAVQVSFWDLGEDGEFASPVDIQLGKATNLVIAEGRLGALLAGRTETGLLRMRALRGIGPPAGSATGPKIFQVSVSGDVDRWFVGTINEPRAAVRTGLGGLSGRLILDTGTMQISRWDFESSSVQSDLVRVTHGELEGIGAIAFEIKVLAYGPIVITVLSGMDTFEKLLEKDRGKPKMRVVVWDSRGDQLVKATHAVSDGKHTQLAIARLALTPPISTNSARFLTAARDDVGRLKLAVWKVSDTD
jgi:hypothetical protein